jgi:hypothetical protein
MPVQKSADHVEPKKISILPPAGSKAGQNRLELGSATARKGSHTSMSEKLLFCNVGLTAFFASGAFFLGFVGFTSPLSL